MGRIKKFENYILEKVDGVTEHQQKIIDRLVKSGSNPDDAKKYVLKNYDYAVRAYPEANIKKLAEIIMSVDQ